jgi:hypothetical protein
MVEYISQLGAIQGALLSVLFFTIKINPDDVTGNQELSEITNSLKEYLFAQNFPIHSTRVR